MSPVGGAPVNAQPDKHNSKDQENQVNLADKYGLQCADGQNSVGNLEEAEAIYNKTFTKDEVKNNYKEFERALAIEVEKVR